MARARVSAQPAWRTLEYVFLRTLIYLQSNHYQRYLCPQRNEGLEGWRRTL